MKLFVLSLALSMTAAAVSAQSALPTPPVTAPPSDANHLSTQGIDTARPELQTGAPKPAAAGIGANTPPVAGPALFPATSPAKQLIGRCSH